MKPGVLTEHISTTDSRCSKKCIVCLVISHRGYNFSGEYFIGDYKCARFEYDKLTTSRRANSPGFFKYTTICNDMKEVGQWEYRGAVTKQATVLFKNLS